MRSLILVFFLLSSISFAQDFGATFSTRYYPPNEYNSHNQVWDVVQDSRGVLFFFHGDGISEFDGKTWSYFPTEKISTVLSSEINSDGRIFCSGVGEFGYLKYSKNGNVYHKNLLNFIPDSVNDITNVWDTHVLNEKVYFRDVGYLFLAKFDNDTNIQFIKTDETLRWSGVVNNELWIQVGKKGLHKVEELNFLPLPFGTELGSGNVQDILSVDNNKLVIISTNSVLVLDTHTGKSELIFNENQDFPRFDCGVKLRDGRIAIGSRKGVLLFNKNMVLTDIIGNQSSIPECAINNLFEDKHGGLWACTAKGIVRISINEPLKYLKSGEDFPGMVHSTCIYNDTLSMATIDGAFQIRKDDATILPKFTLVNLNSSNLHVFDTKHTKGGFLYASTEGLFRSRGNELIEISGNYSRAICVLTNDSNLIAVGGRKDVVIYKYNQNEWKQEYMVHGLNDEVLCIEKNYSITDSLVLWAGMFGSGASRISVSNNFSGHSIRNFVEIDSMGFGYYKPYKTSKGIRFCTKRKGIYEFNENQNKFEEDKELTECLKGRNSFFIAESKLNITYFEANGPIFMANKTLDDSVIVDTVLLNRYNHGYIDNISFDHSNRAWISGEMGILIHDPNLNSTTNSDYHVLIRKFKCIDSLIINNNVVDTLLLKASHINSNLNPVIPFSKRDLRIEYAGLWYDHHEKIQYSYQLEGYNEKWSDWSIESHVEFTNLDPDNYSFLVKSRNNSLIESEVTSIQFTIQPPWYRTIWAYLSYVLVLFFLLKGLGKIYAYRLKIQNEKLKLVIDKKTKEIRNQNQELEIQKSEIEEKNKDITSSIRYAKNLQTTIIPFEKRFIDRFNEAFVVFRPKDVVSGDFYYIYDEKHGFTIATVMDCTGHGVPGAFVSLVGNQGLNSAIKEKRILKPSQVFEYLETHVNDTFKDKEDGQLMLDGMDGSMISVEELPSEFNINCALANNGIYIFSSNPKVLDDSDKRVTSTPLDDGRVFYEIRPDGRPIGTHGKMEIQPFTDWNFKLKKGDSLYLFSDGFQDQFGGRKGKKLKSGNFRELIKKFNTLPMGEQKIQLEEHLDKWQGNYMQVDDITLMGIRF